jgi:hypothetical protein
MSEQVRVRDIWPPAAISAGAFAAMNYIDDVLLHRASGDVLAWLMVADVLTWLIAITYGAVTLKTVQMVVSQRFRDGDGR